MDRWRISVGGAAGVPPLKVASTLRIDVLNIAEHTPSCPLCAAKLIINSAVAFSRRHRSPVKSALPHSCLKDGTLLQSINGVRGDIQQLRVR